MFLQERWPQALVLVILVLMPASASLIPASARESRILLSPEESDELLWFALHMIDNFEGAGTPVISQVSFVNDLGVLTRVSPGQDLGGEWCAKAIFSEGGHFQIYIRPECATWIQAVNAYRTRNLRSPVFAELAVELAVARFRVVYPKRDLEAYRADLTDHILDKLGFVRLKQHLPNRPIAHSLRP